MSISALRSSPSSFTRAPVQDTARSSSSCLPSAVDASTTGQKTGAKTAPGLAALQQDSFDPGKGKGAESLGKLLEDTLSALNTLVQLIGGGAEGAQDVPSLGGESDSQPFSDSSFTPKDATTRPPVELNSSSSSVEPTSLKNTTGGSTTGGSKLGGNLPPGLEKFRSSIESASAKTGVPAEMLAAQIWQESRGNLEAISTNGGNGLTDTGLMQVNPNTYKELQAKHPELQGKDLSDPETNILAGACYMKDMKEQFGGWDLALRAYNSGPNGVDKSNPDAIPAGTGDATYVQKVKNFSNILATGQGTLPA